MCIFQKQNIYNQFIIPPYLTDNLDDEYRKDVDEIKLYKVIPFEYALPIILEDRIRLDSIFNTWQDKHELFFFKQDFSHGKYPVDVTSYAKRIYGQSWSFDNTNEASWRVYGKGKMCVRLTTTVGKLARLFCEGTKLTYFGNVKYKSKSEITEWLKENVVKGVFSNNRVIAESLFIKRNYFQYEKEFRVIHFETDEPYVENGVQYVNPFLEYIEVADSNVKDLISEVEFDSMISDNIYNMLKNDLERQLKSLGKKVVISQSDIYKPVKPMTFDI